MYLIYINNSGTILTHTQQVSIYLRRRILCKSDPTPTMTSRVLFESFLKAAGHSNAERGDVSDVRRRTTDNRFLPVVRQKFRRTAFSRKFPNPLACVATRFINYVTWTVIILLFK